MNPVYRVERNLLDSRSAFTRRLRLQPSESSACCVGGMGTTSCFSGSNYWYHSDMEQNQTNRLQRNPMRRIALEVLLIVFLLLAVRLMAEFTVTNHQGKSLALALNEIITLTTV